MRGHFETGQRRQPGTKIFIRHWCEVSQRVSDLITMLDSLRDRGVKFRSITEAIDTETPTGRVMWQIIGMMAEYEHSLISERTRAGVKAAQRRSVKFGPSETHNPADRPHPELIEKGEARQYVADLLHPFHRAPH